MRGLQGFPNVRGAERTRTAVCALSASYTQKRRRRFIHWRSLAAGFILATILIASTGKAHRVSGTPHTLKARIALAKRQLRHDRAQLAVLRKGRWLLVSPLPWNVLSHRAWLTRDKRYLRSLERQLRPVLGPSWLVNAFLCIHRGEGSWTDPNPPYFGGLQMDYGFQSTYGPGLLRRKGTADHWTPGEQIMVAIRAYHTRGFFPWPTTARHCGLI